MRDEVKRLETVDPAIADDPLARQSAVEAAVESASKANGWSTGGRGGMRIRKRATATVAAINVTRERVFFTSQRASVLSPQRRSYETILRGNGVHGGVVESCPRDNYRHRTCLHVDCAARADHDLRARWVGAAICGASVRVRTY